MLTAEQGEAFEKIGLKLLFTVDTPGLLQILEGLEIEHPAYRVGDLQVQGAAASTRTRKPEELDLLTVQLDLFGFRRLDE